MIVLTRSRSSSTHTGGDDEPNKTAKLNKRQSFIDLRSHVCNQNLFVFHLPSQWTEKDLKAEFGRFGTIYSTRVARGLDGGSKGYGFVCFKEKSAAYKAITEMHGRAYAGKRLKVSLKKCSDDASLQPKEPNDSSSTTNIDDSHQKVKPVLPNAGIGLVTYNNPDSVTRAINTMDGKIEQKQRISVLLDKKTYTQGQSSNRTICVVNLPSNWTKKILYKRFSKFGHILNAEIYFHPFVGSPNDPKIVNLNAPPHALTDRSRPCGPAFDNKQGSGSSENGKYFNRNDSKLMHPVNKKMSYYDRSRGIEPVKDYSQFQVPQAGLTAMKVSPRRTVPFVVMSTYAAPGFAYYLSESNFRSTTAPPVALYAAANLTSYPNMYLSYVSPAWNNHTAVYSHIQ